MKKALLSLLLLSYTLVQAQNKNLELLALDLVLQMPESMQDKLLTQIHVSDGTNTELSTYAIIKSDKPTHASILGIRMNDSLFYAVAVAPVIENLSITNKGEVYVYKKEGKKIEFVTHFITDFSNQPYNGKDLYYLVYPGYTICTYDKLKVGYIGFKGYQYMFPDSYSEN